MAVTELHMFGWTLEEQLRYRLEEGLDEPLTKTKWRYDTLDFESASWSAELKCRRPLDKNGKPVNSKTHTTWLMPSSKIEAAKVNPKDTCLFYYFEGDNTLWYIVYDEELFSTFYRGVPYFHKAVHYYIPADCWTQLVPKE